MWFSEFDRVSESVRKREFQLDCPQIELTPKDVANPHRVKGPGSIFIEGDQLKFKLYSASPLPRPKDGVDAGELVPESHRWSFRANDMAGRTWTCTIVDPEDEVSYCVEPAGVIVTGHLWQVEGRYQEPQFRELRVMIDVPGNFDIPLDGSTQIVSKNNMTGLESHQSRRDSTSVEAAACKIVIQKRDAYVRFMVSADEWLPNTETRLCEAFKFLTARQTWWEALYFAGPTEEFVKIRLRQKLPKEPRLMPPLNDRWSRDYWSLFVKYFDFVSKSDQDAWHAISAFLDDVCEASIGSFSLLGLVLAVAIEGVVKLTHQASEILSGEYCEAVDRLTEHVCEWESFAADTANKLEVYGSLEKRVRGMLSQLKSQRAKDRLVALEKRGIIKSELIKNWELLRNSSAHGKTAVGLPDQGDLDRIDKATALLYAIILDAIGYQGKYTDYSRRGWPDDNFSPAAAHDSLAPRQDVAPPDINTQSDPAGP